MQCPVDAATLLMTERQGVEIDYCPQCRGVWLDRGELDKLLERAETDGYDDERDRRPMRPERDSYPPKKKKRWLSEMFEFD
jgi:Zn-finger nucleic acid-binding protein